MHDLPIHTWPSIAGGVALLQLPHPWNPEEDQLHGAGGRWVQSEWLGGSLDMGEWWIVLCVEDTLPRVGTGLRVGRWD